MKDPRIPIPAPLRAFMIFGGIFMMILGMLMAWRRAGQDPVFPQTGYRE